MRIIRAPRAAQDFTILPNALLRDEQLSYRARGVLVALLSHVDGWESNSESLAAAGKEGRDAIRTVLTELETAGYLTRDRIQDHTEGTWSTVWTIHETPTTDSQASVPPMTEIQSSDTRPSVSQASKEDHQEEDPPTPRERRACARPGPTPHANCRGCGTTQRQLDEQRRRDDEAQRRRDQQARLDAERQATAARRAAPDSPARVAARATIRQSLRAGR